MAAPSTSQELFPHCAPAERVAIYAMFGGIPAYWERIDQKKTISENIQRQLPTPNNLMQEEPRLLLQDFAREPHNYVALLRAAAQGARTQKKSPTRPGCPRAMYPNTLETWPKRSRPWHSYDTLRQTIRLE